MTRKKWIPKQGETFYFIYHTEHAHEIDKGTKACLNADNEALVIGDAECYSPEYDTQSNCFRTKAQAEKALSKIRIALKFTGE